MDKDRLYVTIFAGDEKERLETDEEAFTEWKKWIGEERILKGNKKDNFWEMGDTGPCGPCSEIHVDCRNDEERKNADGGLLVNNDHPQVIEIWNIVFMQFNRLKDGSLEPLPAKHVDTGMGFERLVRVLQGKQSNYDTDIFSGTIEAIEKITGKKYGNTGSKQDVAFRVLSDHIRAIAFTLADGQLPSNTGAGYVIRRILRRAVRYAYSYLDHRQPMLFQLMPVLANQFKDVFPELVQQQEFVTRVIREEEEGFLRTLEKGILNFNERVKLTGNPSAFGDKIFDGESAFLLYDTYGFPIDLTQLMTKEIGWTVDMEKFKSELKKQKDRSRAATAMDTGDWTVLVENPSTAFVGYQSLETKTRIVKYRKVTSKGKEAWQLVLETTPFYAESGGQVGDTGKLIIDGQEIPITDTKKENDLIIHFTQDLPDSQDGEIIAVVDKEKRKQTAVHHSATHLLHAALRRILGNHVAQKGSLVNQEHLRFDFSHFAKVTPEEIKQIEQLVNEKIRENLPVVVRELPKEEALKLGAMALFGEKYGDLVRVVVIDPAYSQELCGGTHVGATGELGFFKIMQESAVAAGVRRIEAISGLPAEKYIEHEFELSGALRETLNHPKDVLKTVQQLLSENSSLSKHIEYLEARQLVTIRNELLEKDEIIGQINFIGSMVEVSSADALKKLCFDFKNHLRDYLVVLCANIGGKPFVAVGIADTVVAARGLDAGRIIKEHVAPLIQGGGGGQKTLATAGGQDVTGLQLVIEKMRSLLV